MKITGSSRRFQPVEMTAEKMKTERHLLVPLFLAERAWAFAMELKDEHAAGEVPKRVRFRIIRKFTKAVAHIAKLAELCKNKVDSKSLLEIEAYHNWMQGNQMLEKEQWQEAMDVFVRARKIYEEMGKIGDAEEQELCKERVGEIDPSLRFCKFNISGGSAEDISDLIASHNPAFDALNAKLETALQESRKQQATSMEKVTWRGRTVPLKSEKLKLAFIGSENARIELERVQGEDEKLAQYSHLFSAFADIHEVLRAELKAIEDAAKREKQKSTKTVAEEANLLYLQNYVTYLKLTKTIERNELLASTFLARLKDRSGKKTKPEDLVRIYDNLIVNIADLESISDQEDTEYAKLLASRRLAYKAYRCFYVALSFAYQKDWPSALALCDHCALYVQDALEHHKASAKATDADYTKLQALEKTVRGEKCLIQAKAYINTLDGASEGEKGKQLPAGCSVSDCMAKYEPRLAAASRLSHFPPECEPVACKPVLFDLAHMELSFPSLEHRLQQKSRWRWW